MKQKTSKISPRSRLCSSLLIMISFFCAIPAVASSQLIRNDVFWKDTSGNPIYSQGGGILKVGNIYYWYGVKYERAVTYAAQPEWQKSPSNFSAVTAYSSTDLVHWKFEGDIIKAGAPGKMFEPSAWVGRLGVVYNSTSHQYVLITQYSSKTKGGGILFATSDAPTGAFTYHHIQKQIENVVVPGTGDQTVFIDDDGKPYLIFSNAKGRSHLYVAPLRASDYLNIEPATNIYNSAAGGREGNAMFKYNGLYYFCSSDLHGWNASHTYCMTASNITGPYSAEAMMSGTEADFSHVSQTGFFIPVQGSAATTILFAGDRWSNFAGNGLGYNQWMPLSFNGTVPHLHSVSEFNLDADAGTWTVGSRNNYILNPSFEADRVVQTSLTGWVTSWTNLTEVSPHNNVVGGHTGRWALTQTHNAPYMGSTYQNVVLPNGTYTLKTWVKSSGGQSVAKIYVHGYGGAEIAYSINTAIDHWTEITFPHIVVSNGSAQVGVYSEGKANDWLKVDDFSLIREIEDGPFAYARPEQLRPHQVQTSAWDENRIDGAWMQIFLKTRE